MGKKLVLMPQTLGPYSGRLVKMLAVYILNRAVTVYSRDYRSLQEIRRLPGVRNDTARLKFCFDVGFILEPVKPVEMNITGLSAEERGSLFTVGFNVSGLLYMGGYTQKNMFSFKIDYREMIYAVIDYLIKEMNAVVMLVPHVFGTQEHAESDLIACRKVYDDLKDRYRGHLTLVHGTYNQNEIKYIIGLCDFFIGSRMHACIAALSQTIPTVSIAYSKKFVGVMETIGTDTFVADPRYLGISEIIEIIEHAIIERQNVQKHLENIMPHVKEGILHLLDSVGDKSGE